MRLEMVPTLVDLQLWLPLSHLTSMTSCENSVWEILKLLPTKKIRQIAPILKEKIQHQALLLSPSKYNEVIGDRYNAVSVKVALHNQAIYLLLQKRHSA